MAKITLNWTYGYQGRYYGPGEIEESKLPAGLLQKLKPARAQPAKKETKAAPKQQEPAQHDSALPDSLDAQTRDLLTEAGFDSSEKVSAASDEDLSALKGVGEARLAAIREAIGED